MLTHWSYIFLALTHRYGLMIQFTPSHLCMALQFVLYCGLTLLCFTHILQDHLLALRIVTALLPAKQPWGIWLGGSDEITSSPFLHEASFGLRVLSLPASVPSVRPSVCLSVTKFVRTITHYTFKLGSPNLDHRCKRQWLRSLLFWGVDWPWISRSNLTSKSKFTPFWACSHNNSSPVQARITKFGSEVQNTLVTIPIILGFGRAW